MNAVQSKLGVLDIPISRIRLNPKNPRKLIRPGEVEAKAASMKTIGQETPIKVRPLTPEEKQEDPDHDYELIGGELRLRAAKSLGWETIKAYVLEVKPGERRRKAYMDNVNQEMFWLDRYEEWEEFKKDDPNLTNQALADMVTRDRATVSKALKLMGVLGLSARAHVRELFTTTPDLADFLTLFETAAVELGNLADMPGTATEVEEKAEACLKTAIDRRMTITQVRQMVIGVKAGVGPTSIGQQPKIPTYALAPIGAPPRDDRKGSKYKTQPRAQIIQSLKTLLPRVGNKGQWKTAIMQLLGVQKRGWGVLFWVFLGLWGGEAFLVGAGGHVLHLLPHFSSPELTNPASSNVQGQKPEIPASAHANAPMALAQPKSVAQPEASQQVTAPTGAPSRNGKKGSHIKTVKKLSQPKTAPVAVSPAMAAWAVADSPLAVDFAEHFYSVSYPNWDNSVDYFRNHLAGDYSTPFLSQYLTPARYQQVEAKRIISRFKADAPPKLLGVTSTTDKFLVQGEASEENNTSRRPELLWRKPVALVIQIRHVAGFGAQVEKVEETTLEKISGSGDLGKEIEGGVKDVAHAVNTVDQGAQAVDAAKKTFGF